MTANNGWPGKPGVPLNPEKDGWHWLQAKYNDDPVGPFMAFFWDATQQTWPKIKPYGGSTFHYLGPVLAPDEAAALQARADRNAAGFARVDAEAQRAKFLHKQEIAALQKRVAELETALKAAAEDIGDWGAYASQYLQEKWDLSGEVKRYTAISEGKLPYRARYSMEEPKDE